MGLPNSQGDGGEELKTESREGEKDNVTYIKSKGKRGESENRERTERMSETKKVKRERENVSNGDRKG